MFCTILLKYHRLGTERRNVITAQLYSNYVRVIIQTKRWKGGIKRRMDPVPVDPVISVNGVNSLVKRDMQTDRINI